MKTCVSLVSTGSPECGPGFLSPSWCLHCTQTQCVGLKEARALPSSRHGWGGWHWLRGHLLPVGRALGWITAGEAAAAAWGLPWGQREEPEKLLEAPTYQATYKWPAVSTGRLYYSKPHLIDFGQKFMWGFFLPRKAITSQRKKSSSQLQTIQSVSASKKWTFLRKVHPWGTRPQQYYKGAFFAIFSFFLSIAFPSFQVPTLPRVSRAPIPPTASPR